MKNSKIKISLKLFLPVIILLLQIPCRCADSNSEIQKTLQQLRNQRSKLTQSQVPLERIENATETTRLYDKLIMLSSDNLNSFAVPADTNNLPIATKIIIETARTDLLEWILDNCRIMLIHSADWHNLRMGFYHDEAARLETQKLKAILDKTDSYLRILEGVLNDLQDYLDNYPDEDWPQRFGETGLYNRTKQLQQTSILQSCILCYYQPETSIKLPDRLEVSIKLLGRLLPQVSKETAAEVQLWRIRLSRKMVQLKRDQPETAKKYLNFAREQIAKLQRTELSEEMNFLSQLEALELSLLETAQTSTNSKGESILANRGRITAQLHQLKNQLDQNKYKLTTPILKKLKITILESRLLKLTNAAKDVGNKKNIYSAQLQFLSDTSQKSPELQTLISELVAGYLTDNFTKIKKSESPPPAIPEMEDFELLCLNRYFRDQKPSRYDLAASVCENFLNSRDPQNKYYPQILYDAGLCYYQQIQSQNRISETRHTIDAIRYWQRLAQDFPQFHSSDKNTKKENSLTAATQAASLAYNLFTKNTKKHTALAQTALATLVGQLDSQNARPKGSYSGSDTAKSFRYYYAITLQTNKQFSKAAQWFDIVPQDSPHKPAARYHAVHCNVQQCKTNQSSTHNYQNSWTEELESLLKVDLQQKENVILLLAELYLETTPSQPRKCLDTLSENSAFMADRPAADSFRLKILHLRVTAFQQLQHIDKALNILHDFLREYPSNEYAQKLAVSLLQNQSEKFLELHSQAQYQKLIDKLINPIKLSKFIYEISNSRNINKQFSNITKIYLELLCLKCLALSETNSHNQSNQQTMLADIQKLLSDERIFALFNRDLWFVRCRAILTFITGDYDDSRKSWRRIRNSTQNNQSDSERYFWWEAKYFSLRCLIRQGSTDQVRHIIKVLNRTRADIRNNWTKRIHQLQQETQD